MTKWHRSTCMFTLLHNYKLLCFPDGINIDKTVNPGLYQLIYRTCVYFHDKEKKAHFIKPSKGL